MIGEMQRKHKFNMKEKFMEWLSSNLKDNSPLLTKGQYDGIIKYLKADDKSAFPRRIEEEQQVTVIS